MSNIECCYDTDEIRSGVISNGDKATIYNFLPEKDQTTFYGSLLQAQLEPDTEHVWAENSNTNNMTSYDSLLSAQYSTPNNLPIRKRSATNEELPALSKIYLAHLHNSTLSSWPSIRKGPESERQHYQNLTAAEFPEQSTLRSSAFAQLSQIYGPLPSTGESGEVASIVNEMTWVGAYRAGCGYGGFEGTDDELLSLMADAYEKTKEYIAKADVTQDGLRDAVPTVPKGEPIQKTEDVEEKGGEIPEEQPVMIGKCVHDKGEEDDDYDDEGDGYDYDVEDGCEDDGIFDDHVIEQYGRQGYGGWD